MSESKEPWNIYAPMMQVEQGWRAVKEQLASAIRRAEAAEQQLQTERARHASMAAEFELIAKGEHPRYWTMEPGDVLFRPTNSTRLKDGEFYMEDSGAMRRWFGSDMATGYPIYRRIDAPAAAAEPLPPPVSEQEGKDEPAPAPAAESGTALHAIGFDKPIPGAIVFETLEHMHAAQDWLNRRAEVEAQLAKYKRDAEAWKAIDMREIVNAAIAALGGLRPSQIAAHESAIHAAKLALAASLSQQTGGKE